MLASVTATPGAGGPFRYADVADPRARDWLRGVRDTIRTMLHRAAADLVRIGQLLGQARDRLEHGQFEEWAAAEFPWSLQTSRRLMQVARVFADPGYTQQIER